MSDPATNTKLLRWIIAWLIILVAVSGSRSGRDGFSESSASSAATVRLLESLQASVRELKSAQEEAFAPLRWQVERSGAGLNEGKVTSITITLRRVSGRAHDLAFSPAAPVRITRVRERDERNWTVELRPAGETFPPEAQFDFTYTSLAGNRLTRQVVAAPVEGDWENFQAQLK